VEFSTTTAVPLPAVDSCARCHDQRMASGGLERISDRR
jgi:hypothetical protein